MATGVARPGFGERVSVFVRGIPEGYRNVVAEMRKVTWPDRDQTIDATWRIIVFVLFLGLVIFVMDWLLQRVLVQWIPSLFGG
jgi:preprotein translocase subunit SecE